MEKSKNESRLVFLIANQHRKQVFQSFTHCSEFDSHKELGNVALLLHIDL